jgi:hypothetical protein
MENFNEKIDFPYPDRFRRSPAAGFLHLGK